MSGVKRAAVALAAYLVTFEMACVGWSAIDIFVFHNLDPKWGDELGTFQVAIQITQYLAVGSGLAFLACLFASLKLWLPARVVAAGLVGVIAGLVSCVLAQRQFGFWLGSFLAVRGLARLAIELSAPGLLAGLLCILTASLLGKRRRLDGAVA